MEQRKVEDGGDSRDARRERHARGRSAQRTPGKRRRRTAAERSSSAEGMAGPLGRQLDAAARAYEADRYQEAARVLRQLVAKAPRSPEVRELYGLTLYRRGRWTEALRQLEAFEQLARSFDQYPVMADCHRALGDFDRVAELWDDLRQVSPSAELVAEGRIVAAGALADQGDLDGAIRLLERARRPSRRPEAHHLRQWYCLADLYERAGDLPKARDLFRRVARGDPELSDAAERLASLG